MKEAAIGGQQPVIAHRQPAEVAEPPDRALDDPAASIAPQTPPVLVGGLRVVAAGGNDGLNAPALEEAAGRIAVVTAVGDHPLGLAADRLTRERRLEERDLRRGRRVQVCSQRRTRAIDQMKPPQMKLYVVTPPPSVRGIYDTWAACPRLGWAPADSFGDNNPVTFGVRDHALVVSVARPSWPIEKRVPVALQSFCKGVDGGPRTQLHTQVYIRNELARAL